MEGFNVVCPRPSLLQAEKPHLWQPVFIGKELTGKAHRRMEISLCLGKQLPGICRDLWQEKRLLRRQKFPACLLDSFFKRVSREDLLDSVSVLLLVMKPGLWKAAYVSVNTAIRMQSCSQTALALWWSFTTVGSVEFPLTDWEQAVLSGSRDCIVLADGLKPLLQNSLCQSWATTCFEAAISFGNAYCLFTRGQKNFFTLIPAYYWRVFGDTSFLPNPLLASSALAASDAGGHKGLAVEHCHLHMVACQYPVSNTLAASICLIYLSISTIHLARGLEHPAERRTVN